LQFFCQIWGSSFQRLWARKHLAGLVACMCVAGHVKKNSLTQKKTESEMACTPSKGDLISRGFFCNKLVSLQETETTIACNFHQQ